MKTALYENKFKKALNRGKLVRINNINSQFLLFTQWSIRFTSRYNVTLFLSISMIFLHSSANACSSSDNNTTYAISRLNCQKMVIQVTLKTKEYDKHDSTKEQRNNETMSNVKLQVITICYILDLNELRWTNCPNKFHYQSRYNLRSSALVVFRVTPIAFIFKIPAPYRPLLNLL